MCHLILLRCSKEESWEALPQCLQFHLSSGASWRCRALWCLNHRFESFSLQYFPYRVDKIKSQSIKSSLLLWKVKRWLLLRPIYIPDPFDSPNSIRTMWGHKELVDLADTISAYLTGTLSVGLTDTFSTGLVGTLSVSPADYLSVGLTLPKISA